MAAQKWAVLIGIDEYHCPDHEDTTPRNDIKNERIRYKSLDGCVNDILAIEKYLLDTVCVPAENIKKLLAPTPWRNHIADLSMVSYSRPTYLDIIKVLEDIPRDAKKGDSVYIHYSGHGARSTTVFAGLKGDEDLDECLVPCDITNGGKYLRDLEMGALLQGMVDAGLLLTVVLDCCHSGGAVRGDPVMPACKIRAIPDIHKSDLDSDKPENMNRIMALGQQDSWLTSPKGFVLLAACRERQTARECKPGSYSYGVLTYYLLRCLLGRDLDISSENISAENISAENISSEDIFNSVLSNVHNHYCDQTPHILGDLDRFFLGRQHRSKVYALSVRKAGVDRTKEPKDWFVILNGHSLNGVQIGSEYNILPFGFDLSKEIEERDILGRVKVNRIDSSGSTASFLPGIAPSPGGIREGCPAVLHTLPIDQHTKVYFHTSRDELKKEFKRLWEQHQGDETWLQLVDAKELGDFIVSVTNDDIFNIDPRYSILSPIMNCLERLRTEDMTNNLPRLIQRLQHAARFKMTKELGSNRVTQPRLADVQIAPRTGSASSMKREGVYWQVVDGDEYTITISNKSGSTLGLTIISCDYEARVARIYPGWEKYHVLDPKSSPFSESFRSQIPSSLHGAAQEELPICEVIKVFVSKFGLHSRPPDLDPLQLMGLGELEKSKRGMGVSSDGLKDLLEGLDTGKRAEHVPKNGEELTTWQVIDLPLRILPKGS
ncbi:caspase domain-containing protein [Hypomontagnella submonticulosa]|nr:caspase domain-containing protein [Hypomontagnella submonticulosa]